MHVYRIFHLVDPLFSSHLFEMAAETLTKDILSLSLSLTKLYYEN